MTGSWGYEPPASPFPIELDAPGPTPQEQALSLVLIEVSPGLWIDPSRIAAVEAGGTATYLYLRGLPVAFEVGRPVQEVMDLLQEKMSYLAGMMPE